jgi:hypothetical protein
MRRLVFAVLALTILPSAAAFAGDSYLYVHDRKSITNGQPVNVKALEAKYSRDGSYFWFSIDGKSYLVREPKVLDGMRPIYDPLFETGMDFTVGEQARIFSRQMTLMKEQLRIGLEPQPGESAATAARRLELKFEQNRLAQRQNELAEGANRAARDANDFARRLDGINRDIERQLRELGLRLIRLGIAAEVRN